MPFYIRVTSLITPVHCITQTEEPKVLSYNGNIEIQQIEWLWQLPKKIKLLLLPQIKK